MPNEKRRGCRLGQAIHIPVKEEAGRFKLMESFRGVVFLDTVIDSPVHEKKIKPFGSGRSWTRAGYSSRASMNEKRAWFEHEED